MGRGGSGRRIGVQQARQLQESGAVLLDVRTPEEFTNVKEVRLGLR